MLFLQYYTAGALGVERCEHFSPTVRGTDETPAATGRLAIDKPNGFI